MDAGEVSVNTVEIAIHQAGSPKAPERDSVLQNGAGSGPLRAETCSCLLNKKSADQKVGLELGMSKDGRWLIISKIHQGSLADAHSVVRPGAKLLDITVGGQVYRNPTVSDAAELLSDAVGELQLTVMPLLDRYGFVVDAEASAASPRAARRPPSQPRRGALEAPRSLSPSRSVRPSPSLAAHPRCCPGSPRPRAAAELCACGRAVAAGLHDEHGDAGAGARGERGAAQVAEAREHGPGLAALLGQEAREAPAAQLVERAACPA